VSPLYTGARERIYIELEHIIVKLGEDVALVGAKSKFTFQNDVHDRTIKALRLDAIVGGSGDYARGFANLVAGTRATVFVGEKPSVEHLTFVRGLFRPQDDEPKGISDADFVNGRHRDLQHIQHAINGPFPKDIVCGPNTSLGVEVAYDGPEVPVAFMRVVLLGVATEVLS